MRSGASGGGSSSGGSASGGASGGGMSGGGMSRPSGGMETSSRPAETSSKPSSFEIKPASETKASNTSFEISEVKSTSSTTAGNPFHIEAVGKPSGTEGTTATTKPSGTEGTATTAKPSGTEGTATTAKPSGTEGASDGGSARTPGPRGKAAFLSGSETTARKEVGTPVKAPEKTEPPPTTPVEKTTPPKGKAAFLVSASATETTPKSETKAETRTEVKVERKPEATTRTEVTTTAVVEPRPEVKDAPKGETKPEVKAEVKAEAKAEVTDAALEKREAALREIALKEYSPETLAQVEHESKTQTFRNGEGKEITKADAVNGMLGDLSGALDALRAEGRPITDAQRQAILDDAKRTLYAQEAESQSRGLGSHGVSHIHGVYERTRDIPQDVLEKAAADVRARNPESTATAADMRAALLTAAIYHDEGYLSEQARLGPGKDGLHGVDSAIAFEHKHAPLLSGAVDAAVLEDTRQAIAEHNVLASTPEAVGKKAGLETLGPARAETIDRIPLGENSDLDPNKNFVRSALLQSDKLALDADEKFPDVLRDPERAKVMLHHYVQQESAGQTEAMRATLTDMIQNDPSLTEGQKDRNLAALRDINPGAGGFDLPMAGVTTPGNALTFRLSEDGQHIESTATLHHRADDPIYTDLFGDKGVTGEAASPEAKKMKGFFEDMGIRQETLLDEHGASRLERKDEDTVVVPTSDVPGLKHVTVELTRINPETVKGDVNETVAALEAQAEQERAAKAGAEIRQEAIAAFREQAGKGPVTAADVLTLCGAVYEGNEAEVAQIAAALDNPDLTADELNRLQTRALALCDASEGKAADIAEAPPAEAVETTEPVDAAAYKARLDRTPVNHGEWVDAEGNPGVRGESKFVPESESIRETLAEYGVDGIEYHEALPDFAPVSRFNAFLDEEDYGKSDPEQFQMCTLALQEEVIPDPDTGRVLNPDLAAQFSEDQLADIAEGIIPEGFTWHHDAEPGTMRLVPTDVHQACRHLGGRSLWGLGAAARRGRKESGS